MLRRAVCAVVVFAFSVGLVMAAEIRGVITKVSEDGKTITVGTKFDKETKKFTEEKEYTVSSTVKVLKGKIDEDKKLISTGEEVADGLKSKRFQGKRGTRATITTDDGGVVTQIIVSPPRKKKNNQ
jgi:hypothetical protein